MTDHLLCTRCQNRPARSAKPRTESGKLCNPCLLVERRTIERGGPSTRRAGVVALPQGRVSEEALARYEAEARKRKVSVYELVSEWLERGPG